MEVKSRIIAAVMLFMLSIEAATAQDIFGTVIDKQTKEPLVGASVQVVGTDKLAATDIDGHFSFSGLQDKSYSLVVKYISYKTQQIDGVQAKPHSQDNAITVAMQADEQTLREVSVTGVRQRKTEAAMIQEIKSSPVIVSNISAQEISRTQDSNAGEVIRRVPGVSLIEDKFVMVRGLSQRYNDVWMNGSAVPSSEADSRAFSFDIVPSSQIDNLTIVKTPSPEYPADYSGGFISINTKEIPTDNVFELSLGGNWNTSSHFKDFLYSKGSGTDFLGFDNGLRSLDGGIHANLKPINNGTDLLGNGLNNDWMVKSMTPFADLKLSATFAHHWEIGGRKAGMIATVNYSNEYRTYKDMQNNLFGIYDVANDQSNYLRHSIDDQYNHNVRLGAMLNFTILSRNGNNKYQFKNIFNQLGNSRYTWREGISAQSNLERSAEYYYRSRTTYNGQLTGSHNLGNDNLDWSVGYAYANRHLPDRRRYLIDDALESNVFALTTSNQASREWTQLDEHIVSANVNDEHAFTFGSWQPKLKFGVYGEYRTREYNARNFNYNWDAANNSLPAGFQQMDIPSLFSNPANFGADKLYLLEDVNWGNNYRGHNTMGAGYLAATLPFGCFDVYTGVRYEYTKMELISNTKHNEKSESSRYYKYNDLFPSLNATYHINDMHQLRASYGRSVNRPEFREVSSSVFYDFDLASDVQGNSELENCYVDNVDLRYEFYPSRGEIISLAAFYKHFDKPIEWTYTVTGGTDLIYSYKNAKEANNFGLELDIRKDLSFIGLRNFSWSFNGALIHSRVKFPAGSLEEDRAMQGQSPYLVNTGLFYKNDKQQLSLALLYNRIGKRIIGVGRSEGSTGSDENARVPDSYEMPRDVFDFTASKKFGKHWELKFTVRDLLGQYVNYNQFAKVHYADGRSSEIKQTTRRYKPGRNIGLNITYKF